MRILLAAVVVAFASCKTTTTAQYNMPGPKVVVYKTKADYSQLVPIGLSDDRSAIVSYPDPADLMKDGKLTLPITLHKGYWLDNRGIGSNVAFLQMSYADYSKLQQPPSLATMMGMIRDADPLLEIYDCGLNTNYKDHVNEINKLIDADKLGTTCKQIK
jgi:hypothetical protein